MIGGGHVGQGFVVRYAVVVQLPMWQIDQWRHIQRIGLDARVIGCGRGEGVELAGRVRAPRAPLKVQQAHNGNAANQTGSWLLWCCCPRLESLFGTEISPAVPSTRHPKASSSHLIAAKYAAHPPNSRPPF